MTYEYHETMGEPGVWYHIVIRNADNQREELCQSETPADAKEIMLALTLWSEQTPEFRNKRRDAIRKTAIEAVGGITVTQIYSQKE